MNIRPFLSFAIVGLYSLILPWTAVSQTVEKASPKTVFNNVRVFDGVELIDRTNVLVSGGKIEAVGTEITWPEGSVVISGEDYTLMPGLIDCHTHAYMGQQLQQALLFGVTTELDMMSLPTAAAQLRRQQAEGKATGRSDYFSAGSAVTVKGGHGTQFGFAVPTLDSAEGAEQFVLERIREGSDYIKMVYESGEAYGFNLPTLDKKMLAAAIKAAQSNEKLAVSHIGSFREAKEAVELGIDGLVHLCGDKKVTDEFVEMAQKKGVFVVPTAAVISTAAGNFSTGLIANDEDLSRMMTPENLANLQRKFGKSPKSKTDWDTLLHNIKRLHKAGVPILVGTDAPNPGTIHGASMMHEMLLLSQAGLDNPSILQGATSRAADCFQLEDRGRVAKGLNADLILVQGNPVEDISAMKRIRRVWKSGVEMDRKGQIARIEKSKEAAKPNSNNATTGRVISNFDRGELESEFGSGWSDSTDALMGGDSKVEQVVVEGGAKKTSHSLKISGHCRDEQPAFAGSMFSPGAGPMQPADLSSHQSISFWAKGDGKTYSIMLFTQKRGFQPSMKSFKTGDEWTQFTFPIADFDGSTGEGVIGLFFGADSEGPFEFQIDEVELSK